MPTSSSVICPSEICSSLRSLTAKICLQQYLKDGWSLSAPTRSVKQM